MTERTRLKQLLYPETVALIGASSTAGRLTARPQTFLAQHGFVGRVFPVNPRRDTVLGVPSFASIHDVPEPVEHAYILLDADAALDALEACGRAGVQVVSMLADGFAESGPEGVSRQECLVDIAARHDMLVIGPNSTGVVEPSRGFVCTSNAAFAAREIPVGTTAVLSQSGSVIGAMLSRAASVGLGHRAFVSVGNEAVAGVGEIGQLLVNDPTIESFVLFLETLRRPDELKTFARMANAADKPIIAYLVGRSDAGQTLASSHTGAMVGGHRALEAFLDAQGIVRVDNFEALVELPSALRLRKRLKNRPKVATVVTTTGGGGGMVYDQIGLRDVPLKGVSDALRARISNASGLPLKGGPLVDVTLAGTKYEIMNAVIAELIAAEDTGLVVAAIGSSAQFNPDLAVKPIVDAVAEGGDTAAPVMAIPIPDASESLRLFQAGGVPAFRTVESAAEAVSALLGKPSEPEAVNGVNIPDEALSLIANAEPGGFTEHAAAQVFQAIGISVPQTAILRPGDSAEDVLFEGPYVLKVLSTDIQHKSDVGGVQVGLATPTELDQAIKTMTANISRTVPDAMVAGFMVQKMATGLGEAIVGLTRDPVVGPMISVGLGGVLTEVYQDLALRPAPVSREAAQAMLDEVKGFATLRGFRGAPHGDMQALADAVSAFSQLALVASISEAEINPLLVCKAGDGVIALDALILKSDESS